MAPLNLLRLSFHIQIQATRGSSLPKCYAVHIIWKEQMRKRRDRNPTARSKQAIYNICEDAHVVHVFISLMSSWCNSEWIHAALRMTNENRFIPVSRSNACIAPCDATLRDMELNLSWILLCTLRKKLNKVLTNVWLLKRKKASFFHVGAGESQSTEVFWRLLLKAKDKGNAWICRTPSISLQNPNWLPNHLKEKNKSSFILTPAFPYNPLSPRLIHGALFRQRFDVCTTWSKIARLGSYPGIIKCPWVLANALHNWREEAGGGWRSKWQCTVLWLGCRVAGECHRPSQRALAEDTERQGRWGEVVCAGEAQLLFSQHIMLISEITTLNNGMLSKSLHLLLQLTKSPLANACWWWWAV